MEEETDNSSKTDNKPWLWKKGFCPNPGGRPKGQSLKEWARNKFLTMTEEEREDFLNGIDKKSIWAMGEGNPDTKSDITSNGETIVLTPEKLALAKEYEEKLKEKL